MTEALACPLHISNSPPCTDTASRSRRGFAREFCLISRTLVTEGAGNAGRSMRPRPRVRMVSEAHEHSHHGHTGFTRHSPRNSFNGFLRALLGDHAVLPPSPCGYGFV